MKRSEFVTSLGESFPASQAQALMLDLTLPELGSRTPFQALEAGVDPQRVWDAVCREMRLPEDARFPHRRGREN